MNPPIHLLLRELEEDGRQEESVEFMEDRIKYLDSLKISVGGGTIRRACDVFVLSQSWDTTDESPPAVPVSAQISQCYSNATENLCIEVI